MEYAKILTEEKLAEIFPAERADAFFDAMYGDADEGAYDISLGFVSATDTTLEMAFTLTQRPGKCLACNLTYGLPQVFTRHPIINLKGTVDAIAESIGKAVQGYQLGATKEAGRNFHTIGLSITVA